MTFILLIAPAVLLAAETPADSKALIKSLFTTRLVVTQCYSVVKNHAASKASHLSGFEPITSAQSSAPSDLHL